MAWKNSDMDKGTKVAFLSCHLESNAIGHLSKAEPPRLNRNDLFFNQRLTLQNIGLSLASKAIY